MITQRERINCSEFKNFTHINLFKKHTKETFIVDFVKPRIVILPRISDWEFIQNDSKEKFLYKRWILQNYKYQGIHLSTNLHVKSHTIANNKRWSHCLITISLPQITAEWYTPSKRRSNVILLTKSLITFAIIHRDADQGRAESRRRETRAQRSSSRI